MSPAANADAVDARRPSLHFTPRSGWINDPHGITYRDGRYHAFFQYVPDSTVWAPSCHWGHAIGTDLLSLTEGAVAIAPGDGDDGIWTGSLVAEDRGRIFYTSITEPDFGIGRIRTATPDDPDWIGWTKGAFVVDAPAELDLIAFRDPFVRREETGWRMFVGAARRDGTAMALTYTSADLETWVYDGVALERPTTDRDPVWMGALWECPQIFTLDGRAVMVSSVWDDDVLHYAGYALGSYADGRFTAETWGRLTFGDSYYAPSLFTDADGELCLSFWMRGISDPAAGWANAHSLPHRLRVDGDRLVARPHPDVASHRGGLAADGRIDGLAADIEWDVTEGELRIRSSDRAVASLSRSGDEVIVTGDAGSQRIPASGPIRVIVDGPVLEVSSAGGIFGVAVSPNGSTLNVTGDGTKVYRLE